MRRWKLSPMDLESRARWVAYSRAKDEMFRYTDIKIAPWYVVEADDKRRARLNCIAHLPAAGEIVIFDRSWYNRAGVERVMGFCTEAEYQEFMRTCPEFEHMLTRSGIQLVKYWFSVSDEEQERRFQARVHDPMRRWKLSPMDLESRARWVAYSRAKDEMFRYTDSKLAPWFVVQADDKRRARLNCIAHLLSLVDYEDLTPPPLELPPRAEDAYIRPPIEEQTFVPQVY